MDLDRVNELMVELAKNGDKQTLKNLAELLTEFSRYKKKENVKKVEKVEESVNFGNVNEHASAILDGVDEKPVARKTSQSVGSVMGGAADILG